MARRKTKVPGGLSGMDLFHAILSPQKKADRIAQDAGFTHWEMHKRSQVQKPVAGKDDIQMTGGHTLAISSANGIRRGPMSLRKDTYQRHKITMGVTVPEVDSTTDGVCIPPDDARRVKVPSRTGQAYIDNRPKEKE